MILAAVLVFAGMDFSKAAADLTHRIESTYWVASKHQYVEEVSVSGSLGTAPAFTWDKAVYLSGLAAGCKIDRRTYQPLFDKTLRSLDSYGCEHDGVYGYSDLPVAGDQSDRYYDDNEWIVLAEIDAYEATQQAGYLADAEKLFKFVMSGESDALGGGIFWRENERKTKNTCSNAPAAFAAARLYLLTKNDYYLQIAKQTYAWVRQLRDTDGLMFDHMDLAGKVSKDKWTYNTALMIESGVVLEKATGEQNYLRDAIESAKAAQLKWIDPATGALRDEGNFAHHLSEAFLAVAPHDPSTDWRAVAAKAVAYAYRNTGKDGLFGQRWDRYFPRDGKMTLLNQASMLRGLEMVAGVELPGTLTSASK